MIPAVAMICRRRPRGSLPALALWFTLQATCPAASAADTTDVTVGSVVTTSSYHPTTDATDIHFGSQRYTGTFNLDHGMVRGSVHLSHVRPHGRLRVSESERFFIDLGCESEFTEAGLVIGLPEIGVSSGGTLRVRATGPDDFHLFAQSSLFDILTIRGEVERQERTPKYLYLDYLGDGGAIKIHAPLFGHRLAIHMRPLPTWSVASSLLTGEFEAPDPGAAGDPEDLYRVTINGETRDLITRIAFEPSQRILIDGEYRELAVDLTANAWTDGRRFARFGVVEVDARWWRVGAAWRPLGLSLWRGRLKGEVAGVVLGFPFLDDLSRFLGGRRHLMAEGELRWRLVQSSLELLSRDRLTLTASARWLRLSPKADIVSWTAATPFSISDLARDSLTLARLDLLQLGMNAQLQYAGFILRLAVAQWLPLAERRRDHSIGTDPSNTGTDPAGAEGRSYRFGDGASLSASVRRHL